jgi:hypothetical protein
MGVLKASVMYLSVMQIFISTENHLHIEINKNNMFRICYSTLQR